MLTTYRAFTTTSIIIIKGDSGNKTTHVPLKNATPSKPLCIFLVQSYELSHCQTVAKWTQQFSRDLTIALNIKLHWSIQFQYDLGALPFHLVVFRVLMQITQYI